MRQHFESVDEYISIFPVDVQEILENIRKLIKETAPEATETISYQIPTFKTNGHFLIYYAAFKNHVSVYPITTGMKRELKEEIEPFVKGKGTLQFPLSKPIPYDLIKKIVLIRLKENLKNY